MTRFFAITLVTFVSLTVLAPLASAVGAPRAIVKKADAARQSAGLELLKLAKACARGKAFGDAARELERAGAVAIDAAKIRKEQRSIAGKESAAAPTFAAKLTKLRAGAYGKCIKSLAIAAEFAQQKGAPSVFEELATLLMDHFPAETVRGRLEVEYFETYYCWSAPEDVARYRSGEECIEGVWHAADAVAALDEEHASWPTRWKVEDRVHRVETAMPFRTARRVLAYVGAYRRFFLTEFGDEWDLRPPKGKLPVILTETQAEFQDQVNRARQGSRQPLPKAAGLYLMASGSLNPCFLTFEMMTDVGEAVKIGFDTLRIPLKHELTHQIAHEYSKHASGGKLDVKHQFWCAEGIANFAQFYVLDDGRWRLSSPKEIQTRPGAYVEGAFAYCKKNLRRLPKLREHFATTHEGFNTYIHYHIAATAAHFLLHASDGRYRASFMELLESVHASRGSPDLWDRCFPGVERDVMQDEWEAFVRALVIERS